MEIRVQTREPREDPPGPSTESSARPDERAPSASEPPRNAEPGALRKAFRAANAVLPRPDGQPTPATTALLYSGSALLAFASLRLLGHLGFLEVDFGSLADPHVVYGKWAFAIAYMTLAPVALSWLAAFSGSLLGRRLPLDARSRVREALVCPYCRDEVSRQGTVVCARPKCGALYHRECWDECSRQYGGCAVYGCSSRRSKEVSAAGYLVRVARLFVAATLFPPRAARALATYQGEGFRAIFRQALERTRRWFPTLARPGEPVFWRTALVLATLAFGVWILALPLVAGWMSLPELIGLFLALEVALGLLPMLLAVPLAVLPTIVFFTLAGIASIFAGELAALVRADEGGATVLGRLRLGLGGKKC